MTSTLPTGIVSLLMSRVDIPGEVADELSGRSTDDHRSLVRPIVQRWTGVMVERESDEHAAVAAFTRVTDALDAAREIREVAASTAGPTSTSASVAVHTAETALESGSYEAATLRQLELLCRRAASGEVVVSNSAHALLVASDRSETRLDPLDPSTDDSDANTRVFLLADGSSERSERRSERRNGPSDLLGDRGVTRRERDVFDAVADRLTNAEIAKRFSVSERTVESHVSSLLRKLDVDNRLELSALAAAEAAAPATGELPPMLRMAEQRARLVGRDHEMAELMAAWQRTEQSHGSFTLVSGEAGIGKTQLAADLAAAVHDRGALVLLGASTDGAGVPYQAVVAALEGPMTRSSRHRLRSELGRTAPVIARVIPAIAERLDIAVGDTQIDDRLALGVAVCGYLERLAARQPVLVILEDLHWASSPTREVVVEIGRRIAGTRVMVLATTRDVAPDLSPSLVTWLASIERLAVAHRIRLDGLDLPASRRLLDDLDANAEVVDARDAHDRTGGNPLLLREYRNGPIRGATMQDFVAHRRARLDDEGAAVVDLAATIGEAFSVDVLALASGRSPIEVVGALERTAAAGLTRSVDSSARQHVFVHALIRDACYGALPAGRRLQLHRAVAAALEHRQADRSVLPELARHAAIAAPLGRADWAADLAERAGRQSLDVGDLSDAAAHFERALDILDLTDRSASRRLPLTIRLGESLAIDDKPRSVQILRDATRIARREHDPEAFADAVCAMTSWGGSISPGQHDSTFVALAEEALASLPEQSLVWRARVQSLLGSHLGLSDGRTRGRRLARGAVELARASGDAETFVRSVLSLRYTLTDFDLPERRRALEEAHAVASEAGLTPLAEIAASALGLQAQREGDLTDAHRWYRRCRELTDANSIVTHEIDIAAAVLAGDLLLADRRRDDAAAVIPDDLHFLYLGSVEIVVGLLRGVGPPVELLEPFSTLDSFLGSACSSLLAMGAVLEGELDRAASMLTRAKGQGWRAVAEHPFATGPLALCAESAVALGDRHTALELSDLLDPLAGTLSTVAVIPWASIDLVRGLARIVRGDAAGADDILEGAVGESRLRGTPVLLARELVALAQARLECRTPISEVRPLVDEARAIGRRFGVAIVEHDIRVRIPELSATNSH